METPLPQEDKPVSNTHKRSVFFWPFLTTVALNLYLTFLKLIGVSGIATIEFNWVFNLSTMIPVGALLIVFCRKYRMPLKFEWIVGIAGTYLSRVILGPLWSRLIHFLGFDIWGFAAIALPILFGVWIWPKHDKNRKLTSDVPGCLAIMCFGWLALILLLTLVTFVASMLSA